jgi:hypothetical protein
MGIKRQEEYLRKMESIYRYTANEDEILHENYLKIDNTHLSPDEAAIKIKEVFAV